jgi:hypothetical protein
MQSQTQAFLDQHGIQKAVEDVINATVKAKPEAPMAFMVSTIKPFILATLKLAIRSSTQTPLLLVRRPPFKALVATWDS